MKRLLVLAILTAALCGCPVQGPVPLPGPVPAPTPVIVDDEPTAELKTVVRDVEPFSDAELSQFYSEFAQLIGRDSDVLKTTEHIRTAHVRAGRLAFQRTDVQGKHPGLGDKINEAIKQGVGLENVNLTPELRQRCVDVFNAVSWALK